MTGPRTRLSVVALGAALAFLPASALASTGYPAEIRAFLKLSYTPACSICHGSDVDAGTGAATAFGSIMEEFGLVGGNNLLSVDGALQGLQGSMSIYITYLQDDVDPNNPSSGNIPGITYGCFNVTGQGPSSGGLGLLVVALALLFLLQLRRRGRTPRDTAPPEG
jgi:MYXO-CTERM domain-containing protein